MTRRVSVSAACDFVWSVESGPLDAVHGITRQYQ